jgi:hypothetical protein
MHLLVWCWACVGSGWLGVEGFDLAWMCTWQLLSCGSECTFPADIPVHSVAALLCSVPLCNSIYLEIVEALPQHMLLARYPVHQHVLFRGKFEASRHIHDAEQEFRYVQALLDAIL